MKKSFVMMVVLVTALGFGFDGVPQGEAGEAASGHADPVAPLLLALTAILLAAKVGGALFERFRQPAVLGELIVGVVLGNLVVFNPSWDVFGPLRSELISDHWAIAIDHLARLGVILLLFEVGLESSVAEMRKVGRSSFAVAFIGVVAPFVLGYLSSSIFITQVPQVILDLNPAFDIANIHMFIGATLCATSVGITARVFKDLGKLQTKEARIILGAAVIDDVLGLIAGIAIGFLVGAIVVGIVFVPRLMNLMAKLKTHGVMLISALLFCFIVAYLANAAGLAPIVGAFAVGLILEEVHFTEFQEQKTLHDLLTPVTTFLVPIFFVVMGIQVRLETFLRLDVLGLAFALTVAAFLGKQLCGFGVVEQGMDRLSVGVGMVPRGEVGLIFASIGKGLGVVDDAIFSAVVIMVIATTLVTPPLLKFTLSRFENRTLTARSS
jgi:Kef-type K+ transport system membrane component KefB